jgi:hypothetical protein
LKSPISTVSTLATCPLKKPDIAGTSSVLKVNGITAIPNIRICVRNLLFLIIEKTRRVGTKANKKRIKM